MAYATEDNTVPHEWTIEEAKNSGRGAYRVKIELTGNPFTGRLADAWTEGWQEAIASDTISPKFKQREERPHYERRPRNAFRDDSREHD